MKADKFKKSFKGIAKAPEKMCKMKVRLTLIKHDEPDNQKSHPKWQCWIEVISAKFISWSPDN